MNERLINDMLDKSEEAFLMAIEIYNKPTINYRLEGFGFFICNAWELLLKAKLLKEGKSIYYPDKPNRTIALSNCISTIFTNDKDPIRKNLEVIINLRNTSTHFVIKEMDSIYLPFMQANVLNYSQKLFDFFERDITEKINSSFLTLVINNEEISEENILSRYGDNIFSKYNKLKSETGNLINDTISDKLAIVVDLNVRIVKDKDQAKMTFRIAKDGEEPARIFTKVKDPNLTHSFTQKRVIELVTDNLKRRNIEIKLNQYDLKLIVDKFNLKSDEKYYYHHEIAGRWGCSQQLIDFVTELLYKEPNILDEIKLELKEKKKNKA